MRHAVALLLVCLLVGVHAPARAETLAEAVASALERFPDFRAVLASRRAAEELVGQARGGLLPSVDVTLGGGAEVSDNASTRPGDASLTRREADINVSQLLFDGGQTSGQVRRFAQRAEGAAFQVANAAENVAARVGLAYLEVMRARGQVALAEENVATHERTRRQVELLADRGAGRRSDAQQAAARLALAQGQLTQLRGQLSQAEQGYRHLVGQAPGALRKPDGIGERVPADLERALAESLAGHPAVLAAERELNAALAERESARGRMAPRITLEAGASRNRDIDGVRGPNEDRYLMLRMRTNLYRGGSDDARVREAEARVDEARANVGRSRNDAQRDILQAREALLAERARLPDLERHAEISVQVVQAYRSQFSIGQRSLLDVLNAESELFTARGNALNGFLGVAAAEMRLLAAMGRLTAALGVALPAEARVDDAAR